MTSEELMISLQFSELGLSWYHFKIINMLVT